jgi:hypothetical protein
MRSIHRRLSRLAGRASGPYWISPEAINQEFVDLRAEMTPNAFNDLIATELLAIAKQWKQRNRMQERKPK